MRASTITVVGLVVVMFAFWSGDAEAQRGRGRITAAPARPAAGGARAPARSRTQQAQGEVAAKSKGPATKGATEETEGSSEKKCVAKKDAHARKRRREDGQGKVTENFSMKRRQASPRCARVPKRPNRSRRRRRRAGQLAPGSRPTNGSPSAAGQRRPPRRRPPATGAGPDDGALAATASIGPAAGPRSLLTREASRSWTGDHSRTSGSSAIGTAGTSSGRAAHRGEPSASSAPPRRRASGPAAARRTRPVSDAVLREGRRASTRWESTNDVTRAVPGMARQNKPAVKGPIIALELGMEAADTNVSSALSLEPRRGRGS